MEWHKYEVIVHNTEFEERLSIFEKGCLSDEPFEMFSTTYFSDNGYRGNDRITVNKLDTPGITYDVVVNVIGLNEAASLKGNKYINK